MPARVISRFVLCTITALFLFKHFVLLGEAAEPEYNGKTATYWIKVYTVGMTDEELMKSGGIQKWDGDSLKKEKETREKAQLALKGMGSAAVPYIVSWIKSADALAYRDRTQKGKTPNEAIKPLPSWVSANDVEWRSMEALKVFGPDGKTALPVVMELLYSKNLDVVVMACESLGSIGAAAEPALPALGVKLTDHEKVIRTTAAYAIGGIIRPCPTKGQQKLILEQLVRALNDESKSVRWNAASALGGFSSDGKDAVPALMESLKAGNDRAASALGEIGPVAKAAVPLLTEMAVGKDPYVRDLSINALKRINLAGLKGKPANIYDETAEGKKQIAEALVIAKKEGKQVILQFGANWCGWCHRLHELFKADAGIAEKLASNYVVVLIDVNEEHNKDIDARYGYPTRQGLPVVVILNDDGKQLTTQDTRKLEAGDHYDPDKVKAFLEEWAAKR